MPLVQDIEIRFWSKVKIVSGDDSCWKWKAFLHPHPRRKNIKMYGMFWIGSKKDGTGRMAQSHRVAWELTNGSIPSKMKVLHKCDNPACVRPSHLFLGSQMENYQDMKKKGRERRAKGSDHYYAKLSESDVKKIRKQYIKGSGRNRRGNSAILAKKFGVSQSTITDVVNRHWRHVK